MLWNRVLSAHRHGDADGQMDAAFHRPGQGHKRESSPPTDQNPVPKSPSKFLESWIMSMQAMTTEQG
jgi:hypothetical protein